MLKLIPVCVVHHQSWVVCPQHLLCLPTRGHSFASIFMKLYHNVWLDDISVKFEHGYCQAKNQSLGQISLKPCSPCRGHSFALILMELYQGPVVQSIVSSTSSLRVISLTVLADSIHSFLIFFAEKMWVAFVLAHFFSKKFQHICVSLGENF